MIENPTDDSLQTVTEEDYERLQNNDAQMSNIEAGKVLSETVRTTLGPKGMDKMLVDSLGQITVTNSGALIVSELDLDNPAAKMVAEVANTQSDEVGDGTTTSLILMGEMLKQAQELLEQGMHPTTIIEGYQRALEKSTEAVEDQTFTIDSTDTETLIDTARAAMTGKLVDKFADILAELVVEAVQTVEHDGEVDIDDIQVEVMRGGTMNDSELVQGTVIEQTRVHDNMPRSVSDAGVAIIDTNLKAEAPNIEGNITIENSSELFEFEDANRGRQQELVKNLAECGVDVVFVSEKISPQVAEYLSQEGIIAAKEVSDESIKQLSKATGADIVSDVHAFNDDNVGSAGSVEVGEINGHTHFFFEECEGTKTATILMRGSTLQMQHELVRIANDALSVVIHAVEMGRLCPGGGATEIQTASQLRDFSRTVSDREQLAIEAFADALEQVPWTLAETAGMSPTDALIQLRQRHTQGDVTSGVDVQQGSIGNMDEIGVYDVPPVKISAIEIGVQAVVMLLRIDDILAAEEHPDIRTDEEGTEY